MTSDHGPSSSVNSWNADYVEQMYGAWRRDPNSVAESWRHFFSGYELAQNGSGSKALADEKQWGSNLNRLESLQSHVDSLIYHYRDLGHLIANLDPLGRSARTNPLLELEAFNLSEDLMDMVFHAVRIPYGEPRMTLREIIDTMERTYCGSIGVEYMDIQNTPERRWLQYRMERQLNQPELSIQEKMRILECLMKAVRFERFLHTNYVGQKRFSLEGSETLIPLLDSIINEAAECNVSDVVLGMAHRGRLNVLANILHKSYEQIFTEFEDNYQPGQIMGDGDVKYHKGYSSTIRPPPGGKYT